MHRLREDNIADGMERNTLSGDSAKGVLLCAALQNTLQHSRAVTAV